MEVVRVSEGGRIVVPAAMRSALGIGPGDDVVLELEDGVVRLTSRATGVRRAQAILRKYVAEGPSMASELLAERKHEKEREDG